MVKACWNTRPVCVRRRAYTLTETIVTAAIMLVLVALFVPAVGGVAQQSKKGKCLSNLARIGYANLIYSSLDPGGAALPVHHRQFAQGVTFMGAYEWGGRAGRGDSGYVAGPTGTYAFLTSRYGTKAGVGPAARPLNKILYPSGFTNHLISGPSGGYNRLGAERDTRLELDLFQCPSDTGYTGIHFPRFRDEGYSSFDHFGTSYTANMFRTTDADGVRMSSSSPFLHRMSDLLSPSTTLAFYENVGRFAWAAATEPCDSLQPGISGTVRGWHGKNWTFNAAFMDGHADTIYMRSYESVRVFQDDQHQEAMRCAIVRGEGWQKDTLPVEPVYAGFTGGSGPSRYEGGIE